MLCQMMIVLRYQTYMKHLLDLSIAIILPSLGKSKKHEEKSRTITENYPKIKDYSNQILGARIQLNCQGIYDKDVI